MKRKLAIETVVANVKMKWVDPGWTEAAICGRQLNFLHGLTASKPTDVQGVWYLPRKWLEEKGYL